MELAQEVTVLGYTPPCSCAGRSKHLFGESASDYVTMYGSGLGAFDMHDPNIKKMLLVGGGIAAVLVGIAVFKK